MLVRLAVLIAALGSEAVACPLGSTNCIGPLKEDYVRSPVYIRTAHAPPPEFDQAKTTKFLAGSTWKPIAADLARRGYMIRWRKDKEAKGPRLRFVDPTTIKKTSPRSTKQEQVVLIRQVDPHSEGAVVQVDDTEYGLVMCHIGKKRSACLVERRELEWKRLQLQNLNKKL